MTCKIERVLTPVGLVMFRVSGRIDRAYAEVLQELTENEKTAKGRLALDLTEVRWSALKPSGRLPLRRPTESNFETVRRTFANGFPA